MEVCVFIEISILLLATTFVGEFFAAEVVVAEKGSPPYCPNSVLSPLETFCTVLNTTQYSKQSD
jgi:hypothetical protein